MGWCETGDERDPLLRRACTPESPFEQSVVVLWSVQPEKSMQGQITQITLNQLKSVLLELRKLGKEVETRTVPALDDVRAGNREGLHACALTRPRPRRNDDCTVDPTGCAIAAA